MADNVTLPGTGAAVAADDVSSVFYQRFKLDVGGDGASVPVVTNVPTKEVRAGTPAQSSVAGSASSVSLLASNANRLGATITNDSTATLYVRLGATASTSNYTVKLTQDAYYEVPYGYTGAIDGIWSAASGNARITELTA